MVELPDDVAIEQTRIAEYYPPDVRVFARDTILAAMLSQGKWAGETTFRNWRTESHIPVLDTHFLIRDPATQRVIGMGTITRDISAQKAQRDALEQANERLATAMRELGESQRFLQGILDYSPNAIVIKSLDGRYMIVNNGFDVIRHLGPDEARGKSDAELFPKALAKRLRENDEQALATRQADRHRRGSGARRRTARVRRHEVPAVRRQKHDPRALRDLDGYLATQARRGGAEPAWHPTSARHNASRMSAVGDGMFGPMRSSGRRNCTTSSVSIPRSRAGNRSSCDAEDNRSRR